VKKWIVACALVVVVAMLNGWGSISAALPSMKGASAAQSSASESPGLDYDFFKTRVEPIFLKRRAGMARCYVCHEEANHALRLVKLSPGSSFWNDEESRRNFDVVSQLVNSDDPSKSKLLLHPLAPEAGGDAFHSGGRQFKSKDDPDWKTLSEWVRGQKATASQKQ
jgi:hypothetical protein